jgi:uncharacterized membrane protein YkvA (DUF1232 family)
MTPEENDYYQKLRQRITKWSAENEGKASAWVKWILLAPDFFHLLVRLSADPEVPLEKKIRFGAVLLYFISPVDLFSELFVGVPGYIEDVMLSAYVLNDLVNEVDASIIEKHWTGDEDLLEVVRKMISSADRILGSGLFRRIKKFLRQK